MTRSVVIKEANAGDELVKQVNERHFLLARVSKREGFQCFNFWRVFGIHVRGSALLSLL